MLVVKEIRERVRFPCRPLKGEEHNVLGVGGQFAPLAGARDHLVGHRDLGGAD